MNNRNWLFRMFTKMKKKQQLTERLAVRKFLTSRRVGGWVEGVRKNKKMSDFF